MRGPDDVQDADVAMREGNPAQAAEILERLVQIPGVKGDVALRLAAVRRAMGDIAGALEAATMATRAAPELLPAHLVRGGLLVALGRQEDALYAYRAALALVPAIGTLPPALQAQVDRARAVVEADRAWRARVEAIDLTRWPQHAAALDQFRANVLAGPMPDGDPGQFHYPGLEERRFVSPATVAGAVGLENMADVIRDEFAGLLAARAPELVSMVAHVPGTRASAAPPAGKWSSLALIADGEVVAANAAHAPRTLAAYRALDPPVIPGRAPNLMFSLLDPGAHIPSHRGLTNTRLVLHLALVVPEGCGLRVGRETREWQAGRVLVFDDTCEHEAWNRGTGIRAVLLCDVWRPELATQAREGIAAIMARGNSAI